MAQSGGVWLIRFNGAEVGRPACRNACLRVGAYALPHPCAIISLDRGDGLRSPLPMTVPHVSSKPDVLGGEPCFDGTSLPVDALFVNLAAGERLDVILNSYPAITREAAVGVLREACRLLRLEALKSAPISAEARARIGPLMHPHDWDGLALNESAAHYRRR